MLYTTDDEKICSLNKSVYIHVDTKCLSKIESELIELFTNVLSAKKY